MKIEIFEDSTAEHRWRIVAGNGEITAQSEGYVSKGNAKRAARRFVTSLVKQLTDEHDYQRSWSGKPGERIEIVEVGE